MFRCVYLIRHGETAWSLSGRHTGRTEVPLTAHGEDAATALAAYLQPISFTHVLVSPRQRAWRTCELAGLNARAESEPDLAEWDYGDFEGKRSVDILQTHPGWNLFRDGCPNGETPEQISVRADRLLTRLRTLPGNIALFSHGHFGRVLGVRWIGLPVIVAQHFLLGTASLGLLGYEHHPTARSVLLRWNVAPGDRLDDPLLTRVSDAHAMKKQAIDLWENEGGEIPHAHPPPSSGTTAQLRDVRLGLTGAPPMDRWPVEW